MTDERFTQWAQFALALYFITGFFAVTILVVTGYIRVADDFKDTANNLLMILGANIGLILTYWYQRQRQGAPS
jgi:hypothetical protein